MKYSHPSEIKSVETLVEIQETDTYHLRYVALTEYPYNRPLRVFLAEYKSPYMGETFVSEPAAREWLEEYGKKANRAKRIKRRVRCTIKMEYNYQPEFVCGYVIGIDARDGNKWRVEVDGKLTGIHRANIYKWMNPKQRKQLTELARAHKKILQEYEQTLKAFRVELPFAYSGRIDVLSAIDKDNKMEELLTSK